MFNGSTKPTQYLNVLINKWLDGLPRTAKEKISPLPSSIIERDGSDRPKKRQKFAK